MCPSAYMDRFDQIGFVSLDQRDHGLFIARFGRASCARTFAEIDTRNEK